MTKKNISKTKNMPTKEKSVKKTSPGKGNTKTGKGMDQVGKKTGSVRNTGNLNPKEKNPKEKNRENKKDFQESRTVFGDHGQSPRNERIYPGKKGSSRLMNDFKQQEENIEEEVPFFEEKDMSEENEEYRSNFPEFRNKPNQEFRR